VSINPVDSFLKNKYFFFYSPKTPGGNWGRIVPKYNQIAVTMMKNKVNKKIKKSCNNSFMGL
jgi:outer membrane protein assembly factor BamE (lipoprotein component of BamABCDE complex)